MKNLIKQNIVSAILGGLLALAGGYIYLQWQAVQNLNIRLAQVESVVSQIVSLIENAKPSGEN